MTVLEFRSVERAYRLGEPVLAGVDFAVEPGEVVGLLGKNGAGKTTLINIAMGMLHPQSGSVAVFGRDPMADPVAVRRKIGYVAEDQLLPEFLPVEEVLVMHRQLFPTWDNQFERELCERFEIDRRARIGRLSRGQARQVALLCAVAHRPDLLLLDEPAGGLDPAVRREFLETAIRLLNDTGTTILFSSHQMDDIERLAGRVVLLHDGVVLLDCAIDAIAERFSLALVPASAAIPATRLRQVDGCIAVRERPETLHAILMHDPQAARELLARELAVDDLRCQPVPLEEIFIELVGGQE